MSEAEERLLTRMKELARKRGYTWVERIPEEELAPSFQQWLQAILDGMLHFDWDTAEIVNF